MAGNVTAFIGVSQVGSFRIGWNTYIHYLKAKYDGYKGNKIHLVVDDWSDFQHLILKKDAEYPEMYYKKSFDEFLLQGPLKNETMDWWNTENIDFVHQSIDNMRSGEWPIVTHKYKTAPDYPMKNGIFIDPSSYKWDKFCQDLEDVAAEKAADDLFGEADEINFDDVIENGKSLRGVLAGFDSNGIIKWIKNHVTEDMEYTVYNKKFKTAKEKYITADMAGSAFGVAFEHPGQKMNYWYRLRFPMAARTKTMTIGEEATLRAHGLKTIVSQDDFHNLSLKDMIEVGRAQSKEHIEDWSPKEEVQDIIRGLL
jgi:small nuclear ribonucleoprotein (snRNP)-like protein